MHGLISAAAGSAWSYGGSILTFVFPMLLFIGVAGALYVVYTKPHLVPGHRYQVARPAATDTPAVTAPGQAGQGGHATPGGESGEQSAAAPEASGAGTVGETAAGGPPAAGTEDG